MYATICDLPRAKSIAVNPRYTTSGVELYPVNTRYTTCRISDLIRHAVVFRRETVVLQVSINLYMSLYLSPSIVLTFCRRVQVAQLLALYNKSIE